MKVLWTKRAEKNLDKILERVTTHFSHALAVQVYCQLKSSIQKLSDFPELGQKVGGYHQKRSLVVEGNIIVYEIFLQKEPAIVIRNIRPRKTLSQNEF